MSNSLPSFSNARKALVANLNQLLTKFNYTATTFSMRLNQSAFSSGSLKHVASAEEVAAWINGTKVPSLYALYKITNFFNVSIDWLLSPTADLSNITGKSFARQTVSSPKIPVITIAPICPTNITTQPTTTKGTAMTAKKNTSNTNAKMRELIRTRTTSTEYNLNLAYRVLASDMQLKDIASKVGVSTRSMRDYCYYGTTVDADVAKQLAAVLKTNTTALGLKLNKETMRYEHVK